MAIERFRRGGTDLEKVDVPWSPPGPMLRCPKQSDGMHPPESKSEFVLLALIRVGPTYRLRGVQDHYLEDIFCRHCGETVTDEEPDPG